MKSKVIKTKDKKSKRRFFSIDSRGQSMMEMVLAMGIFAILLSFLYTPSFQGLISLTRSSFYLESLYYLNEGEEAIRSIAKSEWGTLSYTMSGVATSTSGWVLVGEGTETNRGEYHRSIIFSDVYRDENFTIVAPDTPGASRDFLSKYADIQVNWEIPGQKPISLNKKILLSHYNF